MSAESNVSWSAFRAQFPVFDRYVYLNAGTEGPVPQVARDAVAAAMERDLVEGRSGGEYMDNVLAMATSVRETYAKLLGARPDEIALTESTTSGINTVLSGLKFAPGDEIVTSDLEHPGLLAPLRRLARSGVVVRVVPLTELTHAVNQRTRLIACSHVAWVTGQVVDAFALTATGVPVLLDGAQAFGAVPIDIRDLGVDYYAASGQKWLCGPEGSGVLFVRWDRLHELEPPWPGYGTLADPDHALESGLTAGAARLDTGFPAGHRSAWTLASANMLANQGWDWVHARASFMALTLAVQLKGLGLEIAPRGASTLVCWKPRHGDADAEVARLREHGILVRSIPGHNLVRASCGAWTSEEDLGALVRVLRP